MAAFSAWGYNKTNQLLNQNLPKLLGIWFCRTPLPCRLAAESKKMYPHLNELALECINVSFSAISLDLVSSNAHFCVLGGKHHTKMSILSSLNGSLGFLPWVGKWTLSLLCQGSTHSWRISSLYKVPRRNLLVTAQFKRIPL